ncbi:fungal pheromone mating factor STE2 GPCR-domain-containing protein [Myxozyma melibiosi]|uniref:Fungal pheromone mating factor STE2 GPCR-domain-containing protein n=1 Tax=Myxozyma melibiosi TaxID=54550 RepID=A0ABR1FCH6_9ASCO
MDPSNIYNTPANQTLMVLVADGSYTPVAVADLDSWRRYYITACTVFGVHIGACSAVAIVLAILTKPSRRQTPVFIFNEICLFLVSLRAGLWISYALGPLSDFAYTFAAYEGVVSHRDLVVSAVTAAMQVLITLGIELSLIFQVRVIFDTNRVLQQRVTMVCALLLVTTVAFWILAVVRNIQAIFAAGPYYQSEWTWIVAKVLYAFSITFYSAIFSYKLYRAIRQRRILGIKEFSPLQVILIMTTQIMIIPLVLTIIQMATDLGPPMSSLGTLFVVLSLPLSTLWASATNDTIVASRRTHGSGVTSMHGSNGHGGGRHVGVNESSGGNSDYSGATFMYDPTTTTTSSADEFGGDLEKDEDWKGSRRGNVTVTRTIIA